MTATRYLTEDELIRRAIEALMTSLGPVETARFLSLPQPQRMESVKRHRLWQETLDKEEFLDQVFGSSEEAPVSA